MLPDTVLASLVTGLLTGGAAVATAIVTYRSQRESDSEASKRLYRQHAVREEYEAYRDVYMAFNSCIRRYEDYTHLLYEDDYSKKISEPMFNLSEKLDVASIYLSESEEEILRDQMMKLRKQRQFINEMAMKKDEELINDSVDTSNRLHHSDFEEIFSEIKSVLDPKLNVRENT